MQNKIRKAAKRAFSLVELLVVIAVIGVIAGVAVANLSNVNGNSREVAAKAVAQRIASTFGAGQATGAPGFASANSVETAMDAVGTGSVGGGVNASSTFKVPGVSATMDDSKPVKQQAKHYLVWNSGSLIYTSSGVVAPPVNNSPWYLLIIIPLAQAPGYVATQDSMHPQDEHRYRDLGNNLAAIEYRPK